tara:strand:- start:286 stop:630 length:345 start_codon:yes stop_codon:yes gene_type:complete
MKKQELLARCTKNGGTKKNALGRRDSSVMEIRDSLCEHYGDDLLFADGYDGAIIGVACGHDSGRVVYDGEKMVQILVDENKCTYEEALEYLEFNTFGAHVGEQTPIYVGWGQDI